MPDMDDMDLMQEYADRHSESAFADLVHRHINLVYSVALRCVGNSQDVTQAVFIILAQKTASLRQRTTLTGWLYETTRFTASQLLRTRARQQAREQEAYMQSTLNDSETAGVWRQLAPILEDAMTRLNEKERTLLALRFFENKSGAETAALLGIQGWAAHKRTARALEKLRTFLMKRGVSLTAATIAGAISANSVQAAPVVLAKSVTAVAIAKGAAASGSTLILIKGTLKLMAWTKAKTAIVVGAALLLATGTATVTLPKIRHAYLEHKVVWALNPQVLEQQPPVVLIRPAQPIPGIASGGGGYIGGGPSTSGKMIGLKASVLTMLLLAYQDPTDSDRTHEDRVILSANLPQEEYDFIASTPKLQREALQQALKKKFGLVARRETRDRDVLMLRVKNAGAAGLKLSDTTKTSGYSEVNQGKLSIRGGSLSLVAAFIENSLLRIPVIDQTGLTNVYDLDLTWEVQGRDWTNPTRPILDRILLDQLGLELVPGREPVEMLVIEKAQ
ncbi:MAG: polymerase, sigma-24 subunit, subfamily [Pedosphaera sp.]|nr:polymerase, sigma-24 subunit, subfamily [Pedosphaera sp.]